MGKTCPKCSEEHGAGASLDLFGASFSQGLDLSAAALAISREGDLAEESASAEDATLRARRLRDAARLIERRQEVQDLRCDLKEKLEVLAAAREEKSKQQLKVEDVQKSIRKRAKEVAQLQKKMEDQENQHQKLEGELNLMRIRDTAFEYWEMIKANKEKEALKYLNTMVGIGGHAWRILTEVARLQTHMRKQLERERKEAVAAATRLQGSRHLLDKLEMEHRRKQGGEADGLPLAKRLRSGQRL